MKEILINTVFYSTKIENRRKEMIFKKVILKIITFIAILSVVIGGGINATAEDNNLIVVNYNNLKMIRKLINDEYVFKKNDEVSKIKINNIGGLSIGAKNGMYAIKSNEKNHVSVLHYYKDIDSGGITQKIFFTDDLLGHANAMAIDDKYIYVTMWQRFDNEKSHILRILRSDINSAGWKKFEKPSETKTEKTNTSNITTKVYKDGNQVYVVKSSGKYVLYMQNLQKTEKTIKYKDSSKDKKVTTTYKMLGKKKKIKNIDCQIITPYYSNGNEYDKSITAISLYNQDKESTDFIINYSRENNNKKLNYILASMPNNNSNRLIIQTTNSNNKEKNIIDRKYMFSIKNTSLEIYDECVFQDIFFDKEYGFFVPIHHLDYSNMDGEKVDNSILRSVLNGFNDDNVKVKLVNNGKTEYEYKQYSSLTAKEKENIVEETYTPKYEVIFETAEGKDNVEMNNYTTYELESLSIVKNNNKTRFLISCNKTIGTDFEEFDGIDEIKNASKFLK